MSDPLWQLDEQTRAYVLAARLPSETTMQAIERAIAIWETGCSCAEPGKPEECPECTRGMVNYIKFRLAGEKTAEAG